MGRFTLFVVGGLTAAASIVVACGSDDPPKVSSIPVDGGGASEASIVAPPAEVDAGPWPAPVVADLTNPCGALYLTKVDVGGHTFDLTVDTGSTTLAVAGNGCASCKDGGVAAGYTPSATAKDAHETTFSKYGDGSLWEGEIFTETVHMPGSKPSVPLRIASISNDDKFFGSSIVDCRNAAGDGIIGLGPTTGSVPGTDSVLDQLVRAGMPDVYAFELCEQTGKLWLGGFDSTVGTSAPVYTPMLNVGLTTMANTTEVHYAVDVGDIQIAGKTLGSPSSFGAGVLDTGTTLFLLPTDVLNALVAQVTASPAYQTIFGASGILTSSSCFEVDTTPEEIDVKLPHLTIKLGADGGSDVLDLPPTGSYLRHKTPPTGKPQYCTGVGDVSSLGDPTLKVMLGAAMLRSFVTIFDRGQRRAGFMPITHSAACP